MIPFLSENNAFCDLKKLHSYQINIYAWLKYLQVIIQT